MVMVKVMVLAMAKVKVLAMVLVKVTAGAVTGLPPLAQQLFNKT